MRVGYRTLTVGLGLLSLTSLVNFLIIEPYNFLDYAIIDQMATELWRTYGYLPGLITFMVGLAFFLPSIAQLRKHLSVEHKYRHRKFKWANGFLYQVVDEAIILHRIPPN